VAVRSPAELMCAVDKLLYKACDEGSSMLTLNGCDSTTNGAGQISCKLTKIQNNNDLMSDE